MNPDARITAALFESSRLVSAAAADPGIAAALRSAADRSTAALRGGGRVLVCGNGGSAAAATQFAGELVGAFQDKRRAPIAAIPLGFDPSSLTSVANDFGYDLVFARQLAALGRAGDVLWALSTSGNSANVVAALEEARAARIGSILFTNHDGGRCRPLADLVLPTPEAPVPRVQELHLLYGHVMCELIEVELAGGGRHESDARARPRSDNRHRDQVVTGPKPAD